MSQSDTYEQNLLLVINDLVRRCAGSEKIKRKRTDMRYSFDRPVAFGEMEEDWFLPTFSAFGMDISNRGIGVICQHETQPEERYILDLEKAIGKPCRVPVRIVYCSPILPNVYRCGAVFEFET